MGKLSQEELEMVYKQGEAQRVPGPQVMVQDIEVIEVDIDGRTFWVRPVGSWVLESITCFVIILTINDINCTMNALYSHHNNCEY